MTPGASPTPTAPTPRRPYLLDEHGAAELLGISFWSVRSLVNAGVLPLVTLPSPANLRRTMRRRLIAHDDVVAFIRNHRSSPVAAAMPATLPALERGRR